MKSTLDTTLQTPAAEAKGLEQAQPSTSVPPGSPSKQSDKLLIFVFCAAVLVIGALTWIFTPSAVSDDENRDLTAFPKFDRKKINDYPAQFEAYFNDRLAFRNTMVKLRNLTKYRLWHVSTGEDASVGKNDFLFYMGDDMERVCKPEQPFSKQQLADWTGAIVERQRYFDKHGVKYMFVVAPEKPTVYPDCTPAVLSPVRKVSGIDQIEQALKAVPGVNFVNLLDVEKQGRKIHDTYLKTDTHWNAFGGLLGYQVIMDKLRGWFPQLEPNLTEKQVDMQILPYTNGDCPKLMGLAGWITEMAPKIGPAFRNTCPTNILDIELQQTGWERHDAAAQKLPVALVIHDSFGFAIKPYLYKHFRKVHFYRQSTYSFDEKLLDKYKPDVVVQLLVERRMMNILPHHSKDWRNWLKDKIDHPPGPGFKWINMMPSTKMFNVAALREIDLGAVQPTTSRLYTKSGDTVKFSPEIVQWYDWYLLKSGDQGYKLADSASKRAYDNFLEFIQHSGKYTKAGQFVLPDKDVLTLYARKI